MGLVHRTLLSGMLLVGGLVLAASGPAHAEKITLKIASGHNASWHFIEITQKYFIPEVKKRVEERTDHEIQFIEGFAGAMVKPTEVLEGLQSGIIDVGVFCVCHEGQKLALHNFPYYLPFGPSDPRISVKATRQVYESVPELKQIYESRYNQKVLVLIPYETYSIISRKPIHGPEDLKGLKVGAAGPNLFWVEPLGALPLTVTGPEVYTSFQTGLMDANIVFVSIMDTLKLYDVAPYMVNIGFGSMSAATVNFNLRRFNALPKEVQDIVLEVARDMEDRVGQFTQDVADRYAGIIAKNGAKIIDISEDARRKWADVIAKYPNEIGAKLEKESGMPMRRAMNVYIEETSKLGYAWPIKYELD